MGWFSTALRRSLLLVLIGVAGSAVWTWRRDAADAVSPGPAQWPPLTTADLDQAPAGTARPAPAASSKPAAVVATSSPARSASTTADSGHAAASVVNALVDAPEARSADGDTGGWAEPLADGSCPDGYPIKANDNSGIFHLPDGRFYDRTKPERCYSNAEAAVADGYRQAKS